MGTNFVVLLKRRAQTSDKLLLMCVRESGVRNLKKLLEKIYRKVAFKLVKRQGEQAQTSAAGAATEGGPELEKADAPSGSIQAVSCATSLYLGLFLFFWVVNTFLGFMGI